MGKASTTDYAGNGSSGLDDVGPFNRLSASQVNSFRACQRLWFYEKVLKLKIKQIPFCMSVERSKAPSAER